MQDRYSLIYEGKSVKDKTDTYTFVVSTPDIDRVGDSINVRGIDLSEYKKNAIVLRNHKGVGIGAASSIKVIDNKLIAECQFHEITEESRETKAMIDGGYLKTASIGFEPIKMDTRELTDEDKKAIKGRPWIRNITLIQKSIMLEFSIVDLPANINAEIQRGLKKGIDIKILTNQYNDMITKDSENIESFKMEKKIEKAPIEQEETKAVLNKAVIEKAGAVLSKANIAKLDTIIKSATSIKESSIKEPKEPEEKEATLNDILKAIESLKPVSVLDEINKGIQDINDKTIEPIKLDFKQWKDERNGR